MNLLSDLCVSVVNKIKDNHRGTELGFAKKSPYTRKVSAIKKSANFRRHFYKAISKLTIS